MSLTKTDKEMHAKTLPAFYLQSEVAQASSILETLQSFIASGERRRCISYLDRLNVLNLGNMAVYIGAYKLNRLEFLIPEEYGDFQASCQIEWRRRKYRARVETVPARVAELFDLSVGVKKPNYVSTYVGISEYLEIKTKSLAKLASIMGGTPLPRIG